MNFVFIELPVFSRVREAYLADDDFSALQTLLCEQPDAGDVIPGSGGCRKLRWARPGMGKSGGVRVIYFLRRPQGQVLLVTLYAKNAQENIQAATLKKLLEHTP